MNIEVHVQVSVDGMKTSAKHDFNLEVQVPIDGWYKDAKHVLNVEVSIGGGIRMQNMF